MSIIGRKSRSDTDVGFGVIYDMINLKSRVLSCQNIIIAAAPIFIES